MLEDAKEGLISSGAPSFIFQRGKLRLCSGGMEGDQNQAGQTGDRFWQQPLPPQQAFLGNPDFPLGAWGLAERIQRVQHSQGWTHSKAREQLLLVLSR